MKIKAAINSLRLLVNSEKCFALAAQNKDKEAIIYIDLLEKKLGPFSSLKFGIELVLLRLFISRNLYGELETDPSATELLEDISQTNEYNDAEKLHLMLYVEELFPNKFSREICLTIDSFDLSSAKQSVDPRLLRRFPKLSYSFRKS